MQNLAFVRRKWKLSVSASSLKSAKVTLKVSPIHFVVNNPVNLAIIREQVGTELNTSCNVCFFYVIKKLKLGLEHHKK